MQVFFRDWRSGNSVSVTLDPTVDTTWKHIREKVNQILPNDKPYLFVFAGHECKESDLVDYSKIGSAKFIHIVEYKSPKFTSKTHDMYLFIQNFYEKVEDSQLIGLHHAIKITGDETPEALQGKLETMYKVRATRMQKNSEHVEQLKSDGTKAPKANLALALIAINKNTVLESVDNGDGTEAFFIEEENQSIDYEAFGYLFEDDSFTFQRTKSKDEKIDAVNQVFKTFCRAIPIKKKERALEETGKKADQWSPRRIIAIDHGGTLSSVLEANPDDLVLSNEDGIKYGVPSGKTILPMLKKMQMDNPNCLLASHSANTCVDQLELLVDIKKAIGPANMPHFSLMPVYDAKAYSQFTADNPKIFYLNKNFKELEALPYGADFNDYTIVAAWGKDNLDSKASVRVALEEAFKHYQMLLHPDANDNLDITNSWILDDGAPIIEKAKEEGWGVFHVSASGAEAPEGSVTLEQAITSVQTALAQIEKAKPEEIAEEHDDKKAQTQKKIQDTIKSLSAIIKGLAANVNNIGLHYSDAKQVGQDLVANFEKALRELEFDLNDNVDSRLAAARFRGKCADALMLSTDVLAKDLGWGDYLLNILKAIYNAIASLFTNNPAAFFPIVQSKASVDAFDAYHDLIISEEINPKLK